MLPYTTLGGSSLHPVPVTVSWEHQLMCLPRLELYITFLLEGRNLSYQSYFFNRCRRYVHCSATIPADVIRSLRERTVFLFELCTDRRNPQVQPRLRARTQTQ